MNAFAWKQCLVLEKLGNASAEPLLEINVRIAGIAGNPPENSPSGSLPTNHEPVAFAPTGRPNLFMNEDTSTKQAKWKDLGYANSWPGYNPPALVNACRDAKHYTEMKDEGHCVIRYSCPICRYTYQVDSSD